MRLIHDDDVHGRRFAAHRCQRWWKGSPLSLSPDGLSVMVVQQFAAILLLQWTYSRQIELASLSSLCAV